MLYNIKLNIALWIVRKYNFDKEKINKTSTIIAECFESKLQFSIYNVYLKFPFNSVRLLAANWTFLKVVGNDPFVISVKLFVAITNVFINDKL